VSHHSAALCGTRPLRVHSTERLHVLAEASRVFAERGGEPHALIDGLAEVVGTRIGDACRVLVLRGDGRTLETAAERAADPKARALLGWLLEAAPQCLGGGLAGRIAAERQPSPFPIVNRDLMRSWLLPEHRRCFDRSDFQSAIGAPLRARGALSGVVLALRGRPRRRFTLEDRQLLEAVADRAALTLENARLLEAETRAREAAERAHAEANLLYELTDAVNHAGSLEDVFETSLNVIESALGIDRASILLFDEDGVMRFKAWHGLSEAYRAAVEGHSPWGPETRDPCPIFVPDVSADDTMLPYLPVFQAERIAALAFVPLVHESRLLGKFVLYAGSPRAFSERDAAVSQSIARQIAAALGRKLAQRDRDRLIQQLSGTLHLNELFVAVLGHDLRNPLGAVLTTAQLLLRQATSEQFVRPLTRIMSSGERMARMIDQVLDFTRARTGGIPVRLSPGNLGLVARQVVNELRDANPERRIELRASGSSDGLWDADRLGQVISNLAGNAVQHGDPGFAVCVELDGSSEERVLLRVHSRGALPAEAAEHLFDPFHGLAPRPSRGDGLGLGLYITREIVRAHGGSIWVECRGDHTVFVTSLPRSARASTTPETEVRA
jgi:signal transduction histidine kinase